MPYLVWNKAPDGHEASLLRAHPSGWEWCGMGRPTCEGDTHDRDGSASMTNRVPRSLANSPSTDRQNRSADGCDGVGRKARAGICSMRRSTKPSWSWRRASRPCALGGPVDAGVVEAGLAKARLKQCTNPEIDPRREQFLDPNEDRRDRHSKSSRHLPDRWQGRVLRGSLDMPQIGTVDAAIKSGLSWLSPRSLRNSRAAWPKAWEGGLSGSLCIWRVRWSALGGPREGGSR
jgi:hypothetical protein